MNPFIELGIRHDIVNALTELGFEKPTPIQEQSVPVLLAGSNDFVGLAQTGTGKTAAFGLPLLELLDFSEKHPQAVILCPTRELCLQISNDLKKYAKNLNNVNVVAVYGGASISDQLRQIRRGVQIVVATPGRMLDILGRNAIDFSHIKYVVLDEADEMLNMGFQEDINNILSTTPATKKTWLFSATMPREVRKIAKQYMTDPVELTMGTENTGNANIDHEYYVVRASDKFATFKRIIDFTPGIFGIVFCRTKIETQDIAEALIKDGYNANALHGDLSQQQRDKVMKQYRDKSIQLLIATDVASRGIDVKDVTHVINYSLPDELESYTHRSGRTARAGKSGVSISIINVKELGKIRQIERTLGKKFVKAEVPSGFDVVEKQLFGMINKLHNVTVNEEQIAPYMPRIMQEFGELSKEELIKKFASVEFNRFLEYYKNSKDLNVDTNNINVNERNGRPERSRRDETEAGFTRLFINVGSVDEFNRGDLLGFICNSTQISGKSIGKIDLKGVFSFFEVENDLVEKVYAGFKTVEFNGREVRIENAGARQRESGGRSGGSSNGSRNRSSSSSHHSRPRTGGSNGSGSNGGYRGGASSSDSSSRRPREKQDSGFRDFSGRSKSESKKRW